MSVCHACFNKHEPTAAFQMHLLCPSFLVECPSSGTMQLSANPRTERILSTKAIFGKFERKQGENNNGLQKVCYGGGQRKTDTDAVERKRSC